MKPNVSFDVLLRGPGGDVPISAATLDQLRPSPEHLERCFRWLSTQGVTCHRTDFGLACEAPLDVFEKLFSVSLARRKGKDGRPWFELTEVPIVPAEIAALVDQVSVAPPPDFF